MKAQDQAVLVIGELNVDIIAAGLEQPPQLGKELEAKSFEVVLGSASAIFASGMSKLGHPVAFVSKVGDDSFGQLCRQKLAALGVDTEWVQTSRGSVTGVTICLSTRKDRAQVTFPGAIAELSLSDVPRKAFEGFSHLHLSCYALQKRLRPDFPWLLATARRRGLTTSFDPNSTLRSGLRQQALGVLPHVDLLFLNEQEAAELSGKKSAAAAASQLSERAGRVVVKLGARGALSAQNGKLLSVPGRKVRVVDTTGAGDSFAAGYVAAFLGGGTDVECLTQGNACGALSTRGVGGTAAQAYREELIRFLAGGTRSPARRKKTRKA
ncbi:MAG TPA: sugar kinase [Polyangiaceae bacterium]|nr:sugar kinase [Polyangiaceae bacterium]